MAKPASPHNAPPAARQRFPRIAERVLRVMGKRLREGGLRVDLPDGRQLGLGQAQDPGAAVWQLTSAKPVWRSMARGDIGFAESYLDGEWDSPELTTLLEVLGRNDNAKGDMVGGIVPARWLDRLHHWRRRNTQRQSQRNIAYHYDLGNAFYREWLDPTMTYSSALFDRPEDSLETAQRRKYQHLGEMLELSQGQDLLEIGCGWGGFAEHALSTGARVHGISLSKEQTAYARERLAPAVAEAQCELEIRDYRALERQYDRIASIEMLEAVGERYWPAYAASLKRSLRPGGVAGIQTITIAPHRFARYRRNPDFIQRYIFPGGMLPSEPILADVFAGAGLRVTKTVRFGLDYARTLAHWRERFDAAWPRLSPLGFDERFRRMWRYYLCYCEAGFRLGVCDVVQLRVEHV